MTLTDLTPPVVRSSRLDGLPVAIIGAGPIGLAAAAHLSERGIDFVIFEAGADRRGQRPDLGAHAALLSVVAACRYRGRTDAALDRRLDRT